MAEESLKVLDKVKDSDIWTASTTYYTFYYSLYSLMLRVGIKCEIHSCSLEFMKVFLKDFYDSDDIKMIQQAFSARKDLQYYADRSVDGKIIEENKKYCKSFYIKTKDMISNMTEKQVIAVRDALKKQK
jgi:uncharacterized protein (UPF0332 family)